MSDSINAKGEMGDLHTVPQLLGQLRNDDYTTRENAKNGLWQLGGKVWNLDKVGESAIPDLLIALHDEDYALRMSAIWALHQLAESKQLNDPELRNRSTGALINLLSDKNDDVRLSAVYALTWYKDARAVPVLTEQCLKDEDRLIAAEAASLLGQIKDERAVPALLEALNSTKDTVIRHNVIMALGSLADTRAVQPLIDLLLRGDNLRGYAAISLGEIGDKQAMSVLVEALRNDSSQEVREWIVVGLGRMKDPHAIPDLIQVLNTVGDNADFTYRLRYNTVYALREIGDKSALPALIEAINDAPEWQIRMAAIDALEYVTTPEKAASLLIQLLLDHETDYVRGFAARALGFLAKSVKHLSLRDRIVSHLIKGLSDTGKSYHYMPLVCDEAARSLHFIGTPEALAAIKSWQQDAGS